MGDPFLPVKAGSEEWGTPEDFYNKLDAEFNFTLDAAASDVNHKCEKYYTKDDDGANQSWKGETVFCNPPYNAVSLTVFAGTAYFEAAENGTTSVLLYPANKTDQAWFHKLWNAKDIKVDFRWIQGRLKFVGTKILKKTLPLGGTIYFDTGTLVNESATFASVVIIVKPLP